LKPHSATMLQNSNSIIPQELLLYVFWPLVREGAHKDKTATFRKQPSDRKKESGHKSQSGLNTLTYWLTVSCKVTSTSVCAVCLGSSPWKEFW
jgi:hypothetical protein